MLLNEFVLALCSVRPTEVTLLLVNVDEGVVAEVVVVVVAVGAVVDVTVPAPSELSV